MSCIPPAIALVHVPDLARALQGHGVSAPALRGRCARAPRRASLCARASCAVRPAVRALLSAGEARERCGTRELADEITRAVAPSLAGDPDVRRWWVDSQRFAASPGAAAECFRMLGDTDISDVLPTIRVPTLVTHRAQWRDVALRVAGLIPGARAVQLPGYQGPIWADDEVAPEIARFLAGRKEAPIPDSVLSTVLFTDIVGSTERAAALGDRGWRDLLARHHAAVRRELVCFRGQGT